MRDSGILMLAAVLVAALLTGCYSPSGGWFPKTLGPQTYWSTPSQPKTVTIREIQHNDVIFAIDIPVGQQLVLDFAEGNGDVASRTPDSLRWGLMPRGHQTGSLQNQQSVPPVRALRIDVTLRPAPEAAPPPDTAALRTDDESDRPDWWTAEGGAVPAENAALTNYDK